MTSNFIKKEGMEITDHSITKEIFHIEETDITGLWETKPYLSPQELERYYNNPVYQPHSESVSLFDRIYNMFRSWNTSGKIRKIERFCKEGTILDIGCGVGYFLSKIKQRGWTISGVEPSSKARGIASNLCGVDMSEDISLKSLESGSADVITMFHVLEHVDNIEETVEQLARIIKSDGTMMIALPNYRSFDAEHYGSLWAAYDVPRHRYHLSKEAVSTLFNKADLSVVKQYPMRLDSYYVSLLSEQYKSNRRGVIQLLRAYVIGAISNIKALFSGEYSSIIYVIKRR